LVVLGLGPDDQGAGDVFEVGGETYLDRLFDRLTRVYDTDGHRGLQAVEAQHDTGRPGPIRLICDGEADRDESFAIRTNPHGKINAGTIAGRGSPRNDARPRHDGTVGIDGGDRKRLIDLVDTRDEMLLTVQRCRRHRDEQRSDQTRHGNA
jgi:hypothetical protein